ncbi:MAG: PPE domain-containing protein [Mycobacterium sp.]
MHFAVPPPEVNSGRIYAGPGVGPMLASAWDKLANELHSSADDFESVVARLTSEPWQGPAAASMGASAAPQTECGARTSRRCTASYWAGRTARSAGAASSTIFGELRR